MHDASLRRFPAAALLAFARTLLATAGLTRDRAQDVAEVLLEAMTIALAGHGRHVHEERWGCSVFLMLIDPAHFGGRAAFARETSYLAAASRSAAVPPGQPAVRMPGDQALRRRADQLALGVALHPDILPALQACAGDLNVEIPTIQEG